MMPELTVFIRPCTTAQRFLGDCGSAQNVLCIALSNDCFERYGGSAGEFVQLVDGCGEDVDERHRFFASCNLSITLI